MATLLNRRRYMGTLGEIDYSKQYLTFEALESGTFRFTNNISYSVNNGATWISLLANTDSPTITAGDRILWKASGITPDSTNGSGTFSSTGNFNVEGNAMSLLYGDNFRNQYVVENYALRRVFRECSKLISAEFLSLPATIVGLKGYSDIFAKCSNLTTAPELHITSTGENCCDSMFSYCSKLTKAPTVLPATTLSKNCYAGMFWECLLLEIAPILPAITLVSGCYNYMFRYCSKLKYIKAMFTTTPGNSYTNNWTQNVPGSGTFVKNSSATWNVRGASGIPNNWTIETTST